MCRYLYKKGKKKMRKKKEIELKEEVEDTLVAIGDIHGLTKWRKVVEIYPAASRYVFLGDYCDPYGSTIKDEKVVDNLIDIIDFKKKYPERVVLLWGNHDMHYLNPSLPKGSRFNVSLVMILHDLFTANESLFMYAFACNHLLFTHAGVLKSWFEEFGGDLSRPVADQLNTRKDKRILLQCSFLRGGSDNHGGPLWADIDEFGVDELLPGYVQLVGHNRVTSIRVEGESTTDTGHIVFCDSLYRDHFLVVERPASEEPDFYEDNLKKNV